MRSWPRTQEIDAVEPERARELRKEIAQECGSFSTTTAALFGPLMLWLTRREERRLERGVTYEPETFIERRNWVEAAG